MIPSKQYFLDNQHRCTEGHVKKRFPDLYNELNKSIPYREALYQYYHGTPNKCPVCGKSTKFYGFVKGYAKYCSSHCSNNSGETKNKYKKTCLERYGVENISQLQSTHEKIKQTNLERYGVESAMQSNVFKIKSKQTNLERYGVTHSMKLQSTKDKYKQTCLERYGVEYVSQTEAFKKHISDKHRQNNLANINFLLNYGQNGYWICKCPHSDCDKCTQKTYITTHNIQYDRTKNKSELCTILNPIGSEYTGISYSSQQFFQNVDKDKIGVLEKRIGPYIVDWCYKNVVIEFNGDYWHANPKFYSEDWVNPTNKKIAKDIWDHDTNKIKYLESLGYDVYIVWESDFINNSDVINDIIKVINNISTNEPISNLDGRI